jgi:hypothetical protein
MGPDSDVFQELTVFLTPWTSSIGTVFLLWKPESERLRGVPSWAIHPVLIPMKSGGRQEAVPLDPNQWKADGGFWTWLRLTPIDVVKG